ncbi:ricin-type beta-trefoil lectin domain protein [Microbacterium sp. Leaf179]|uniref:ricin-type beta-trefoil lectin domain protein n=1 Tax=Microbacterium sp. Leaf179 TaxID=1736288 RepID=UPI0009E6D378|nr:ricin-type beta-trefoil lectin domain protein [Microbacterium sp. Leaf179]
MLNDETFRTTFRWRTLIAGLAAVTVSLAGMAWAHSAPANAAAEVTFTVNPQGDDAADGSSASPFKTIERARDAVRAVNDDMTGDIRVVLEGGTYPITQTIDFTVEDSGTNGHRVIYSAAEGERPVLDAGTAVTGWTRDDGDVWKAPLARDSKLRSLYVDGRRAQMASTTVSSRGCVGTYSITAGQAPWAWESGTECDGIAYDAGSVPAISRNVGDIEITSATTWTTALVGVRAVDTISGGSQRLLRLQQPGAAIAMGAMYGPFATGGTHTISNAYEFLDTAGEFYFDRAAQTVFYKAAPGVDMSNTPVVAPNELETVLDIAGNSTSDRVQNLTFEGLTVEHTDWNLATVDGSMVKQATQSNLSNVAYAKSNWHQYEYRNVDLAPAAIEVSSASGLSFTRNSVKHVGADGISLMNDVVDTDITGNSTSDIGGTAISIGHPQHVYIGDGTPTNGEKYMPGVEGAPTDIRVTNNYLYDTATLFAGSPVVAAYFLDGLVFEHNRVEKTTWNGISLGWGWKDFDGDANSVRPGVPTTVARDNSVRYNAFYDTMGALADSAPIYTLGSQPGTELSNNYIQGVGAGHTYGLHPDEGSASLLWDKNVLNISEGVLWALNSGVWGRQNNLTITNTWSPNNKIYEAVVPQSRIDNLLVFPDKIWPREAYDVALGSGLQSEYWDLLASPVLSSADQVLPTSVRVESGSASIPIRRSADPTRSVWIAPEGTTSFVPGATITTASGSAESIAVPATPGKYRLFTLDSAGAASSPSAGVIWRIDPAPTNAKLTETRAGRCIDVGGSGSRGVLADCDGGADQAFTYTAERELRVLGKCLAAEGGHRALETQLAAEDCTGSPDQKWEIISNGNLVGVGSGLCVDGLGGGNGVGTRIGLWTCSDAVNQVWRIVSPPVTSAPAAPTGVTAASEGDDVLVSWTAPSADGGSPVLEYRVYAAGGTAPLGAAAVGSTQVRVTGVAPGTTATYEVSAVNAVGESPRSAASASVTTPAFTVKAESRCVGGKAYVLMSLRNNGQTPLKATMASTYGDKSFTQVGTNKTVAATVNSRVTSLPSGQVTATVEVGDNSWTRTAPYSALSCR